MDYVQIGSGVLLVVAAAAGVVGFFRANVSRSTIALYKEDNAALRARLKSLEEEVALDKARIGALEAKNTALAGIVTQAAAIQHLQATIELIGQKLGVVP